MKGQCILDLAVAEQRVAFDFLGALAVSRDVSELQAEAYPLLTRLIPADHAAFCVSNLERPGGYDWLPMNLPRAWFDGYAEMAPHDFVREAVAGQPNLVLRDADMIEHPVLERNMMYHRARELGMSMEHVMAVLLHVGEDWHAGVTLYRDSRRAFTDRERGLLQIFTPYVAGAVRSKKVFGDASAARAAIEGALKGHGFEAVVVALPGREISRSAGATALLDRWFAPGERGRGGLPPCLVEHLRGIAGASGSLPADWTRPGASAALRVSFVPAPGTGATWALVLCEVPLALEVPAAWLHRGLTPREIEVVARLLRGWDNRLIAEDLGCTLGTVKKHLQRIFDKLGVPSRAALLHAAMGQT